MILIPINMYSDVSPDLNIAEVDVVEGAAAPGQRLVIWLQGCLKRCLGCANGPFLPIKICRTLKVEQLLGVMDDVKGLGGITLSGGEPVLQATALIPVLEAVHRRGLSVVCYTGYLLEELKAASNDPSLAKFLEQIDLLIDGEYQQELPRAGTYRPSSNQRLHFLSGRISPESCKNTPETVFTIARGRAVATGTLPISIRRKVFEKLRSHGISLKSLS